MNSHVEACFLIGEAESVLWADRSTDPGALPDSRARWEAIWAHRDELTIVAHSHPGGPLAFSTTDRSTMVALDAALGRALEYAVVTPWAMIRSSEGTAWEPQDEPWWAWLLRSASGIEGAGSFGSVRTQRGHDDEEEGEEGTTWGS